MNERVKAFMKVQKKYRSDPVAFARDITHFEPDENQAAVMMDVAQPRQRSLRPGRR